MSVESWARRASGLLVPRMGFANHPLGRWQPCVGPCCGFITPPIDCEDCGFGNMPESLWVDMPTLTGGCSGCDAAYGGTHSVPLISSSTPPNCYSYNYIFCPWPDCPCAYDGVLLQFILTDGQCLVEAYLAGTKYYEGCYGQGIAWQITLTSPLTSPIDITLPFVWEYIPCPDVGCSAGGGSIRIYE